MEKLLICFFLFTAFSASAAPPTPPQSDLAAYDQSGHRSPQWDDDVRSGLKAVANNTFSTAAILFQKAYAGGCRDPLMLTSLALFRESKGELGQAKAFLLEAEQRFPTHYPNHPLRKGMDEQLGRVLFKMSDYASALPRLETALKAEPQNFMLLFMTGHILREQKKFAEAEKRLTHALSLPPPADLDADTARATKFELMLIAYETKKFDSAYLLLKELLQASPQDPALLHYKQKLQEERRKAKEREIIEGVTK